MFTTAIFDMDGLLIDSERAVLRAWQVAAAGIGVVVSETEYASVIGRTERESAAILERLLGGRANVDRVRDAARQQFEAAGAQAFPLKSGAGVLLKGLRERGVRCAVASSSSSSEIRVRLGAVGVLHHFETCVGGNEVSRGKPDPEIYALAARRLGVDTLACLAFEDSENGARAALGAGMGVVVVPDLCRPSADVTDRALAVLDSLDAAIAHVHAWFAPL